MEIIIITTLLILFFLQVFFFFKLGQLLEEVDQLQEETEILNYQYFELQKLLKEQLMTTV